MNEDAPLTEKNGSDDIRHDSRPGRQRDVVETILVSLLLLSGVISLGLAVLATWQR